MAEPWIRVHANIGGKPVVWRAKEALGVSAVEAVGLLVQFWGAVSQHATNGRIAGLPDSQLEAWAGWTRKKGKFAAFIRASHVDADGRVNEWDEYAGQLEDRKEKDRNRKRRSRGRHADSPQDVTLNSAPTIRNDNDDETKRGTDVVEEDAPPIAEPELTALYLTIWANKAALEKWPNTTRTYTQGSAYTIADELRNAGVDPQVARLSIYQQCRENGGSEPPGSVNYFRKGILKAWDAEKSRRAMVASGEQPPTVMPDAPKVEREHWSDKKKREERDESDKQLARSRAGNVDTRRAKPDGQRWWARMLAEAKAAGAHPTLYAYDRTNEPAEVNRASA